MTLAITAFVALGLVIYVVASFTAPRDEVAPAPSRDAERERGTAWVRHKIDRLNGATPVLLALIWIGYGSLHLAMPTSASAQMPDWPSWIRDSLWYGSGVFEIAIGLMVVNARFRRLAIVAQLGMLIALTPFVIFMLGKDAAIRNVLPGLSVPFGRCVLVFHNLLLFVWTARAYRDELKRLGVSDRQRADRLGTAAGERRASPRLPLDPLLIVALVMLAVNIAGCAVIAFGPWQSGALYLWGLGSLAVGALVGFLFGVPRWVAAKGAAADGRTTYEPNTNIEKLSDWLTQMLVGVGLVELHQLGPALTRTCSVLANGLTLRPGRDAAAGEALAFAIGLVSYFLVAGLIQGYLLTRMFIARAWQHDARRSVSARAQPLTGG